MSRYLERLQDLHRNFNNKSKYMDKENIIKFTNLVLNSAISDERANSEADEAIRRLDKEI